MSKTRSRGTGAGANAGANTGAEAASKSKARTAAEWITLAASLLVMAALVGLVIFDYLARGTTPPRIEVHPLVEDMRQEDGLFYLPVEVTNRGEVTAENLQIELTLIAEGGAEETVSFAVNFLAGRETHHQTVVFTADPRQGELKHVAAFSTP